MTQNRREFMGALGVLAATTGLSSTHAHAAAVAADFITDLANYGAAPPAAPAKPPTGCTPPCSQRASRFPASRR